MMSSDLSNNARPLVMKDVHVQATLINEDGTVIPFDYKVEGVCTGEFKWSREVERHFNADGSVASYLPGPTEASFLFRHNPLVAKHPELLTRGGKLDSRDENGWVHYEGEDV
jgi:hypothetical protein